MLCFIFWRPFLHVEMPLYLINGKKFRLKGALRETNNYFLVNNAFVIDYDVVIIFSAAVVDHWEFAFPYI